ncbi:MAG: hypothetical protein ACLFUU_06305 [Desulfobacteraceae bacterium]
MVLKELVSSTGHKWERWAENFLPFLKARTRQEYMLLGSRVDAHAYAWMDKQKLMLLINATDDLAGADRIGAFMAKHRISVAEQRERPFVEFKLLIDTALAMEKIARQGLTNVDRERIQALVQLGVKIEGGLVRDLQMIQDTGGNVNQYLLELHQRGGKADAALTPRHKVEHFNNLGNKLKGTLDYLMREQAQEVWPQVNTQLVTELIDKLNRLAENFNRN